MCETSGKKPPDHNLTVCTLYLDDKNFKMNYNFEFYEYLKYIYMCEK